MTKEKAIEILQEKIKTMNYGAICANWGIDKDVFEMAINSLQAEEKAISRMERQIKSINRKIEANKKYFETFGRTTTYEYNLERIYGAIEMLQIATGKSYAVTEKGIKENEI